MINIQQMPENFLKGLSEIISTGLIASFGGASMYLYKVSKGQDFKFTMFFVNMFIAFFVGYTIGKFIPPSEIKDGMVALSGVSATQIFQLIEQKGITLFAKILGLNDDKKGPQ